MARFRILGIPVQIDPWFLLGLFFVYSWAGQGDQQVGLFAAVAIGILTLIHELGHATVARSFGCEVSVRLNLFVGWASYQAARPLRRREQIAISLAGPLSQLAVAMVAMTLVHRFFLAESGDPMTLFNLWRGLTWAGVVIALLNLLPLWPLDGGHVVHHLLGRVLPPKAALRTMLYATLALLVVVILVATAASNSTGALGEYRDQAQRDAALAVTRESTVSALWATVHAFPSYLLYLPWFLVLFSGVATFQTLGRLRGAGGLDDDAAPSETEIRAAMDAERQGWAQSAVPKFPAGWSPSPWLVAHVARRRGDERGVAAALAQATVPGRRWVLPDPQRPELAALIPALGPEPPVGEVAPSLVLARILAIHASPQALLDYVGRVYATHGSVEALYVAVRGLISAGHPDDAMRWLERAQREVPDLHRLTGDPMFLPLHGHPAFGPLVDEVTARTS
ncbi:MAG: site-2 protease family protein [Ilumatobacteraceae bacterium]